MNHPIDVAREIARLIESDPIAASIVKEHIRPQRLRDLLEIDWTEQEKEFFLSVHKEDPTKADVIKYLFFQRMKMDHDDRQAVDYVIEALEDVEVGE